MRLFTAIAWFFKILFRGNKAFANAPSPDGTVRPEFHHSKAPALQVLGLLQKEGRLIDFLREDVSGFSDADIGAAVRPIHAGCKKVLDEYFVIRRVMEQAEGDTVTIESGFDASAIELYGSVGDPPHNGSLIHGGYYADETKLPTVPEGADPNVIVPAQVEVTE